MGRVERVLLAIPNFRWQNWKASTLWNIFPYNLCLLAAMIEHEYDVVIVDANVDNLSEDAFLEIVAREKPDVVGISILTNEYALSGHYTAELIKKSFDIPIVMGGIYPTSSPVDAKADKNVDFVIIGEGEYIFPQLLGFMNGTNDMPTQGVTYSLNGSQPKADFVTDLDALPRPAYHKIDFLKYANLNPRASVDRPREYPYARILTSRGCSIGCSFCEVEYLAGKKFRARSPENVVDEIEWLKEKYGIKSILFDDDNMLLDRKRAHQIFKLMIQRKLNLKWNSIATAVFLLNDELLELMRESGCQYLDVAIESNVDRVLHDLIHKPVNSDHAHKIVKKARELGIDIAANFIVGYPGETWDEIRENLHFAQDFEVDYVKISIATPLPNTKMYSQALESGYLGEDFNFKSLDWSRGTITTPEFNPFEVAVLRAFEWDRINFTEPQRRQKIAQMMDISENELNQIRKRTLAGVNHA